MDLGVKEIIATIVFAIVWQMAGGGRFCLDVWREIKKGE